MLMNRSSLLGTGTGNEDSSSQVPCLPIVPQHPRFAFRLVEPSSKPACIYSDRLRRSMATKDEQQYHAKDALTPALKTIGVTGAAGLFVASIQATLTRQNIGALGTFTRFGTTITTFGAFCLDLCPTGDKSDPAQLQ